MAVKKTLSCSIVRIATHEAADNISQLLSNALLHMLSTTDLACSR